MRICNEDLTLPLETYFIQQVTHPVFIQLFKNIIHEQDRREAFGLFQGFVFCQFQGKQQAFPLALGSDGFKWLPGEPDVHIILVNTGTGPLQQEVFFPGSTQERRQVLAQQLAVIDQFHGLFQAGDLPVELTDQGQEGLEKSVPFFKHIGSRAGQLFIINIQEAGIPGSVFGQGFQETIALYQHSVVFYEGLQIVVIQLGQEGVQEPPALFAAPGNDLYIIRSDDHTGKTPYMKGEFIIYFSIGGKLLFAVLPQDANHLKFLVLPGKMPFDPETGGPGIDVLLIGAGEIALGEAQVVDGIQQIGLAYAVFAANPYDPFPELESRLVVILKLNEGYVF